MRTALAIASFLATLVPPRAAGAESPPRVRGPSLVAPANQPEAAPPAIERLTDIEATEELLRSAPVATADDGKPLIVPDGETGVRTKIRFRVTLRTPAGGTIDGLFKGRQRNYRDWIGEILCYRLGRALGMRLTPTVQRRFLRSELESAVAEAGVRFGDLLHWETDGGEEFVRGSLTYWVPGFRFRIGEFNTNPDGLERITSWLGRRYRDLVAGSQVLRDLTAVFLLDFLVFNEDRHHNVGAVRRPGGDSLLLVAIDWGDTLYNPGGRDDLSRKWLWRVELFPRTLVERLRALDPDEIVEMLTAGAGGGPAVSRDIADAVLERRDLALRRIDGLVAEHGEDAVLY
ncbi:MAG: hypothetical protein QME96_06395 [Myxococcota bacterium]|nr:hypothetical protein [Myxococcota bacterium]